jgi:hypothetical protein
MLVKQIAIVPETDALDFHNVLEVTAAIQKQVSRDFTPIWNIPATVAAFQSMDAAPIGYWPVRVVDELPNPADTGFHKTQDNQPYALVLFTDDWSIAASHEVLEMLADPSGDHLVASDSVNHDQGRVRYLVEVCDPVQEITYKVNGIEVCDFYTPQFFDPVGVNGVRYSFTGALSKPKQILRGGYLSFMVPSTRHWWRQQWFDSARPTLIDLGVDKADAVGALRSERESLREMMDRITREHLKNTRTAKKKKTRRAPRRKKR